MKPSDIAATVFFTPIAVGWVVWMGKNTYYLFRDIWRYTPGIPDKIITICAVFPFAAMLLGLAAHPLIMIFKYFLGV